jgi:ribonuclease-3 family protein
MEAKNRNSLALAYIGDAIYEVYIREYLLNQGLEKVNKLQKEATKYVSARGQADYLKKMIEDNFLTEDELQIVMRARNHKTNSSPKNTDIITYKNATGLEALIGCLYLEGNNDRIAEIMNYIKER